MTVVPVGSCMTQGYSLPGHLAQGPPCHPGRTPWGSPQEQSRGGREELAVTPVPGETLGGGGQAAGGGVTAETAPVMEPETRSVCLPQT